MSSFKHGTIRGHPFFRDINWRKVEARELDPPFVPRLVSIGIVYIYIYD